MADIQSIHDKVCDLVELVSDGILGAVYRYPVSELKVYPAARVLFMGDTERMLDTVLNEQTMTFLIQTLYPIDESEEGYQKWLRLYDAMKAEIRKDDHQTLDGTAVYFMLDTTGQVEYSTEFTQPVTILTIRVVAKVLQSITS